MSALRHPLVRMALIGVTIFALTLPFAPNDPDTELFVDPGAPRTPGREDAAAFGAWVDEEILLREGLARGVHLKDPLVRRRLIELMEPLVDERTLQHLVQKHRVQVQRGPASPAPGAADR